VVCCKLLGVGVALHFHNQSSLSCATVDRLPRWMVDTGNRPLWSPYLLTYFGSLKDVWFSGLLDEETLVHTDIWDIRPLLRSYTDVIEKQKIFVLFYSKVFVQTIR